MTYQRALQWLYATQAFGIKLGLDNVKRLIRECGASSIDDRSILHVAGTNGKGSVCAMADAIFREAGLTSGLFTSPHLVSYRERMRVNGVMASEAFVAETLSEIREIIESGRWEDHPTFFEITLVLACRFFIEEGCDVVVLETGMGGRLDATNALQSDVSVITPIALDHQQWLGETLAEIAREKAGIIKQGRSCVTSPQLPDVERVLTEVCESRESRRISIVDPIPEHWTLGLAGEHQRMNAAVARAAVTEILPDLDEGPLREGLKSVIWAARFQRIRKDGARYVIDGAHNSHAIERLVETWRKEMGEDAKATIVFGAVGGKDVEEVLAALRELVVDEADISLVKVNNQRGLETDDLLKVFPGGTPKRSLAVALGDAAKRDRTVLITGSLFLAGEAVALLSTSESFESSEQ